MFGLETEVGISVLEDDQADVVEESIQLVRCAAEVGSPHLWDYSGEDPHQDARGFRAEELRQDHDEANFFHQDQQRPYSFEEIKSDFVLRNGARLYNDHTHPEYSTPECSSLADLVAQDKAGERILEQCARVASQRRDHTVRLYKNNTDFAGHSYGCHENYLLPRSIPWNRLVAGMTPFLVTRQIYAGAGKVGWEAEDESLQGGFQISQRADFFSELVGIDTMNRRPLINTRDEPHADPSLFRRFHVIIGDANLAEFSTWLKVGTTALVLEALQHEALPVAWHLQDPLGAHQSISRDTTQAWIIQQSQGGSISAVEWQQRLCEWIQPRIDWSNDEKRQVLTQWQETLESLRLDPLQLKHRLDWVAKWSLLDSFRRDQSLEWDDPWLQSLDLEYSLLDRNQGLYYALEQSGQIERQLPEERVVEAIGHPPSQSRAYLRGVAVRKFGPSLHSAQWDRLGFRDSGKDYRLDLGRAFPGPDLDRMVAAMDGASSVRELIHQLDLKPN